MMKWIWLAMLLVVAMAVPGLGVEAPSAPAYGIRMEQAWIPMQDGIRLSATLYVPDGAKPTEKFPAILEYQPYRKDDAMAERDYGIYTYFARRGYVCARVDIRGFGTSEGIPTDREYSDARASRRFADYFLARATAVVEWECWNDGNFVEWI